ncbi:hypothetical protein ACFT9M_01425 [Micromonospora purpureochromogenes]|uniref:hypothetical protein n=1 Tax=Micromonospora purpureochromogenes TaxID=47872 RepID=UPI0036439394
MTNSGMSKRQSTAWASGLLLGLVIGLAIFRDTGGVAFGVAIGVAFAVAFGGTRNHERPDKADTGE